MTAAEKKMSCPRCGVELVDGDVQGVAVSRCPDCEGIWFDQQGFVAAKELADPAVAWLEIDLWKDQRRFGLGARRDPCPQCGRDMAALRYGDTPVEVDVCLACRGIWLDEGEFPKILTALEDEVARMPTRDLLAAALHEAAEVVQGRASLAKEWKHAVHILQLLKLRLLVDHPRLQRLLVALEKGTPFA